MFKIFSTFFIYMRSFFLHGLLAILPIAITGSLFYFTLEMIKTWLTPIRNVQPAFLGTIPYSEIGLAFLIILLIGIVLKLFIFKSILNSIESLIFKVPLIKPVYSGIKQLTNAFSLTEKDNITFKQVVLLEFPLKGVYSLGFLTTEVVTEIAPHQNEKFFNIFVPTTPNPTTGYFVIVPESNLEITKLTRQEAMAMIISGGILQPSRLTKVTQKKL